MATKARTLTLKTILTVEGADKLRGLGRNIQRAGTALSVGVTGPLALLGGVAARAASDLNESMNAINVTFGETSAAINEIGKTSAQSFGLSQRAFNEVATRFSAFATTVAGEGGDVAKVIKDLTQRGSDFASVYNLDVQDALTLFQSGLAGETEPLRKFGIDLSAAAVAAHATATGLNDGTHALTEAEKVQARYSLLMAETSKVQGDFANTSGDVANAQRIAAAEAEDAAAKLGQKFLPIQQKVIAVLSDALDAWNKLPAPVQDSVVVFGAAAAALGPLLIVVGTLVRSLGALIKLGPGIKLFFTTSFLGPIGLAITATLALREAIKQVTGQTFEEPFLENLLNGTEQGKQALVDLKRIAADTGQSWSEVGQEVKDAMDEFGLSWDQAVDRVENGAIEITEAGREAIEESGKQWEQYQAQTSTAIENSVEIVTTGVNAMADEVGLAPQKMADELLAAQFRLTDATSQLVTFMEQALSPAQEAFQIQGFLASKELANALTSNNPLIRKKAEEMSAAATDRLRQLRGEYFTQGYSAGATYASGLAASTLLVKQAAVAVASATGAQIGIQSEPKDHSSPLYGITKWGGNIVRTVAEGMTSNLGVMTRASQAVASALVPGTGARPAFATAGAVGAGGTTIINNNFTFHGAAPELNERTMTRLLQRVATTWG